jgi:hypothetical protein
MLAVDRVTREQVARDCGEPGTRAWLGVGELENARAQMKAMSAAL